MRIVFKSKGFRDLLTDPAILADVRARAQRIADASGYEMKSDTPHTRARAAVVAPDGDPDNKMLRSMDFGR